MSGKDTLLPSDNTVTAYWITNPDNVFIDNVAAGSDENGFWWSLPEPARKGSSKVRRSAKPPGRVEPGWRNSGATLPTPSYDGFMLDRNINREGVFGLAGPSHVAKENPADEQQQERGITPPGSHRLQEPGNGGSWSRGEELPARLQELQGGGQCHRIHASSTGSPSARIHFTSLVVDSLFVEAKPRTSATPVTPEEKAYGRKVCRNARFQISRIRAYEYYDYRHDVVNTTFVEFPGQTNSADQARFPGCCIRAHQGLPPKTPSRVRKYINAKPVYFPKIDSRFDSDNRSGSAYRTAAIHDLDGSTTGIPDSYVLLNDGENDSVATDDTCKIQPTWNASVCAGDIGRLQFAIRRGGAYKRSWSCAERCRFCGVLVLRGSAGPAGAAAPARGAAPGRGAGAAPAGAAGAAAPITLSRNGKDFKMTANQSTVRAGTEIRVKTERPEVSISLSEMARDSWVVFELPGFANTSSGKQQDSIDALRKATETSYFKGPDAVWVKLVIPTAPKRHWHGSVWPVGYSNQRHYGKADKHSLFARTEQPPSAGRGFQSCAAPWSRRGRIRSSLSSGSNAQQHPVVIDGEVLQKRRSRCTTPGKLRATRRMLGCLPY